MSVPHMISRVEALEYILALRPLGGTETLPLNACLGRVLAEDVVARVTLPPAAMSAMDGYAVEFQTGLAGSRLNVIAELRPGMTPSTTVSGNDSVRVFTGSVIPPGATHVIIQEDVTPEGETILVNAEQATPRNIRKAGLDFSEGETVLQRDNPISPLHLSIAASANHASLTVRRNPKVGLISSGDELRPPGDTLQPGQIIASNAFALSGLIRAWGGEPVDLGIARDAPADIARLLKAAPDLDLFVAVGGASVGAHDYMQGAFKDVGFAPGFSKVAIRPGKPTWFARRGVQAVIGLPGNPATAFICAHLFLKSAVLRLQHMAVPTEPLQASLCHPMAANGTRETLLPAILQTSETGTLAIKAISQRPDTSVLTPLLKANSLIIRPAGAPAAQVGNVVQYLEFNS